MTNEELNTALYKKVFAEQEKYREWLLSQPPDEILNHCYEYTVREDNKVPSGTLYEATDKFTTMWITWRISSPILMSSSIQYSLMLVFAHYRQSRKSTKISWMDVILLSHL